MLKSKRININNTDLSAEEVASGRIGEMNSLISAMHEKFINDAEVIMEELGFDAQYYLNVMVQDPEHENLNIDIIGTTINDFGFLMLEEILDNFALLQKSAKEEKREVEFLDKIPSPNVLRGLIKKLNVTSKALTTLVEISEINEVMKMMKKKGG
jgi:hypothetical protein